MWFIGYDINNSRRMLLQSEYKDYMKEFCRKTRVWVGALNGIVGF